jgi:tetratricopeptide (TPR) repeat protein
MQRRILVSLLSSISIVLILASSFWTVTITNAVADQPNPVKVESQNAPSSGKSDAILQSPDNLRKIAQEQITQAINSYMLLGYLYKNSKKYDLAEAAYNRAIELSKTAENTETLLFSKAELVEVKYLAGKIDQAKLSALMSDIRANYEKDKGISTGQGSTLRSASRNPCPAKCKSGRSGYILGGLYCISCT